MRSFTVIDVPQRSPEWFAARLGRLSGSCAGDMLAKIKTGEAAGRRNLRLRLVLERLTNRSQESDFVSPAMQTGIDREAEAFSAFESLTGSVAIRTGFLSHNDYLAGASLDGHTGNFETLLSIKCRQPAAHLDFLKSGTIPASALAQMRHELWVTGADLHEYFSWNPDYPPALQSRVVALKRKDAEIPAYEDAALAFLEECDREVLAIQTLTDVSSVLHRVQEQAHAV